MSLSTELGKDAVSSQQMCQLQHTIARSSPKDERVSMNMPILQMKILLSLGNPDDVLKATCLLNG